MTKKVIVKGEIGNAITSTATDHTVAVAHDIFDEVEQKYQEDLNKEILDDMLDTEETAEIAASIEETVMDDYHRNEGKPTDAPNSTGSRWARFNKDQKDHQEATDRAVKHAESVDVSLRGAEIVVTID